MLEAQIALSSQGQSLNTLCDHNDFVRWWEIAFPTFLISYISSKSFRLNHYDTHSSHSHTRFSHLHKTMHSHWLGSQKNKWISNTHKKFWNSYSLTHVSLRNVTEHEVHTQTSKTHVRTQGPFWRVRVLQTVITLSYSLWIIRISRKCVCTCAYSAVSPVHATQCVSIKKELTGISWECKSRVDTFCWSENNRVSIQ